MNGYMRITRKTFFKLGGLANPRLHRTEHARRPIYWSKIK